MVITLSASVFLPLPITPSATAATATPAARARALIALAFLAIPARLTCRLLFAGIGLLSGVFLFELLLVGLHAIVVIERVCILRATRFAIPAPATDSEGAHV